MLKKKKCLFTALVEIYLCKNVKELISTLQTVISRQKGSLKIQTIFQLSFYQHFVYETFTSLIKHFLNELMLKRDTDATFSLIFLITVGTSFAPSIASNVYFS